MFITLINHKSNLIIKLIYRNKMFGSWQKSQRNQKKQLFQQKFKRRVKYSQPEQRIQTMESDFDNFEVNKNKHHKTQQSMEDDRFEKTACKLEENNFSHHSEDVCLCSDCTCGRHLCKMHVVKPNMTKNTVYQKSFYQQHPMKNLVLVSKQYDKLKGPHLEMNSTYHQGFQNRKGDQIQRPKPEDLLSSKGPAQQLTSYSSQFPGHYGNNQYVKPTDRHVRGCFPLRSKSTYSGHYTRRPAKKDDYKYIPDQLKTGIYDWLGNTSYDAFYSQPNPEYFAKKVKVVQKKEERPRDQLQFRTTYKSDFLGRGQTVCPAKVQLTKFRGSMSENKDRFNQNSDFKTISRNFAAISTSKFTQP